MKSLIFAGLRLMFGGVFLAAGALKLGDPAGFQQDILAYRIVESDLLTALAAVYLPWLEILCGLLVVGAPHIPRAFPRNFYRPALLILALLMPAFMIAYFSTILRGIDISCGCFGQVAQGWSQWQVILRDAVLTAVGFALLFHDVRQGSPPEDEQRI